MTWIRACALALALAPLAAAQGAGGVFSLEGLDIPTTATLGEAVAATATLRNAGGEGSVVVSLVVDGDEVDAMEPFLAAGDSMVVTLYFTPAYEGLYEVAMSLSTGETTLAETLEVVAASSLVPDSWWLPSEGLVGQTQTMRATIRNEGNAETRVEVWFLIDGDVVATQYAFATAGGTREFDHDVTFDSPGVRTLAVSLPGEPPFAEARFEVSDGRGAPPQPSLGDTGTTPAKNAGVPAPSPPPEEAAPILWPIAVLGASLVIVGGAIAVTAGRR